MDNTQLNIDAFKSIEEINKFRGEINATLKTTRETKEKTLYLKGRIRSFY